MATIDITDTSKALKRKNEESDTSAYPLGAASSTQSQDFQQIPKDRDEDPEIEYSECENHNTSESSDDEEEEQKPASKNETFENHSTQESKNDQPPPKKLKSEWVKSYSDKAMNLMKKMGYDENKGLGKMGQGRLEPVQHSEQKGRRGLGLHLDDLSTAAVKWDAALEEIKIPEQFTWLNNNDHNNEFLDKISIEDLTNWVVTDRKKLTIENETRFCDPEILKNILSSKSAFDKLTGPDMRKARTRCNPFETIRGCIFQNRAAVKMANMDSMCDFMFTSPLDQDGQPLVREKNLLYFADVCAGPGGFSEYVLYKKKWHAKGFGFTLKNENDFKLDNFYAGPPETFDPYYGVKDDGDIYDTENQDSFQDYVLKQTDTGVHFVMADGGFSVEGQENIQEVLSKQLYLCQCLVALSILREKGHFVCKLFDLFTPFSVGLIYLMYKCFDKIAIIKPNTSRPANSERYLVCKWRKPNITAIHDHLKQINIRLNEYKLDDSDTDICELVSADLLMEDKDFFQYIVDTNNEIGRNQIVGLIKIAAFSQDLELKELNQDKFKKQCLELWKLPDQTRIAPAIKSTEAMLSELLQGYKDDNVFLTKPPFLLKSRQDLERHIKSVHGWYFVPVGRNETSQNVKTLFLCKGKNNILKINENGKWEPIECSVEISANTIFFGEILSELCGEGGSQSKQTAIHIIDGLVLGGYDIRKLPLKERLKVCDQFARSLNKPYKMVNGVDGTQKPMAPIRCKRLYALEDFNEFFYEMKRYRLKDRSIRFGLRIHQNEGSSRQERFYVPGGLMFFTEINSCYQIHFSKSQKKFYYFNHQTQISFFKENIPNGINPELFTSFRGNMYTRLYWEWENIMQVEENVDPTQKTSEILFRNDINEFIRRMLER